MVASADAPVEESLVGAILSRRFRLTRELGRGGMGAVYEASPLDGGSAVAIKILHAHFIGDTHVLQRFLEEGRTYMRLLHANILGARVPHGRGRQPLPCHGPARRGPAECVHEKWRSGFGRAC